MPQPLLSHAVSFSDKFYYGKKEEEDDEIVEEGKGRERGERAPY